MVERSVPCGSGVSKEGGWKEGHWARLARLCSTFQLSDGATEAGTVSTSGSVGRGEVRASGPVGSDQLVPVPTSGPQKSRSKWVPQRPPLFCLPFATGNRLRGQSTTLKS